MRSLTLRFLGWCAASLLILMSGCARGEIKDGEARFYGWGSFKQGDAEIKCEPPIKIGDFGGLK